MKVLSIPGIASALLFTATAASAAQTDPAAPQQGMRMMQGAPGMGGEGMMGMMPSGAMERMQTMMTIGCIVGGLLALSAIFALVSLGIYLLRKSATLTPPSAGVPRASVQHETRTPAPA